MEVLLKFAKLYDKTDFHDEEAMRKLYDDVITIDFTRLHECIISKQTEDIIVMAMNLTPPNFMKPDDWVLDMVVEAIVKESTRDNAIENVWIGVPYEDFE